MKKHLLTLSCMAAVYGAAAQSVITDTVVMGAAYANQVWYSLSADEQGAQPKNNWDLAFRIEGSISSDILANPGGSGALWLYPNGDKTAWASVDTTGLSTWSKLYNAETEWTGALGRYTNPSDPFDLGWGLYDMGTHYVLGDSVYILKTQAGSYKKLFIDKLASGTYTFTYSNLDGSDSSTSSVSKLTYSGKNYAYFSLDTKTIIDREPLTADWDIVFGQYATADYAGMGMPGYVVTGILLNDTLEAALAKVDPATRSSYVLYGAHSFSRDINTIGYNWKQYTGGTYVLNDSSIYFVRTNTGDIWKLIITAFSSADGSVVFSKEKLDGTAIAETTGQRLSLALSPNPVASGQRLDIAYHFSAQQEKAILQVYDLSGRVWYTDKLETAPGLHTYGLNTHSMPVGTYILRLLADKQVLQQKMQVR